MSVPDYIGRYPAEIEQARKKIPGRPSNLTKFLLRQADLFPDEKIKAELELRYPQLASAARPGRGGLPPRGGAAAPLPPATNRGGKSK